MMTLPFGISHHHMKFAGTITLRVATRRSTLRDFARRQDADAGLRGPLSGSDSGPS